MTLAPFPHPSPLRYPGGKGKIANFVKLVFLENELLGGEYVEPYAGGASVALSLLYEDYASHVHINDINRSVHAFWSAVLNDTDALCARITRTQLSVREWRRQRAVQAADAPDPIDLAFSTFVLNRTNRSGIIANGGIIGGLDQSGPWKLDARYNVDELVRRIRKVARFRDRITLTNDDAADMLERWTSEPSNALVYLDPPYYLKGDSLYENFYEHEHHVAIARLVRRLRARWIVSYDAAPEILDIYRSSKSLRYSLSYSARERYEGSEVMFFGPRLRAPKVETPARISPADVSKARQLAFS